MKNDAALWQRGMEWGKELLAPPPHSHAEAYRHELKYLISYADKAELAVRMAPVLHLDPHAKQGGYFIRSLYFDDYWNTAYAEKDAGVLLRKKYRVRVYNCSDRSIKLERKKKFGSWIYKEAAPLTRAEFERILAGDYDFLLHSPHRLCQEFYTECVSNVLRPRVIVDYDREPWILDAGTVRVTFDMASGPPWAAGTSLTPRCPPCRCWSRASWCWKSSSPSFCPRSCGISSRPGRRS